MSSFSNRAELLVTCGLLAVIAGAAVYFLRPPSTPIIPKLEATRVTVSVAGEVKRPGVYTLPFGSRVNALIEQAGGYAPNAEPSLVNPVQILTDGDQIRVPNKLALTNPESGKSSSATPSVRVNVNTASIAELEALPGVGAKMAQRIVEGRPYARLKDLDAVKGIGANLLKRLEPMVRF
jgi:competence protein ComEA